MSDHSTRGEFIRRTIAVVGVLAGLGSVAPQHAPAASTESMNRPNARSPRRPNILFIMTDQQRHDCVGANGNQIIQTPHLDQLAAASANFSHTFVQAPVCVPSRASFFTGRYPHAHRNRVNYTELDTSETLMQARLQRAGYRTGLVGKTHLYYKYPPTREAARQTGFDFVELHDGVPRTDPWSDYVEWRHERDPLKHVQYRRRARSVKQLAGKLAPGANPFRAAIAEQFTDTTWCGELTRHHLRELARQGKPWFLFSSFWKPHSPFEVPAPFDSLYDDVDIPLPKRTTLDDIHQFPLPLQKLALRGRKPPYDTDRERLQWIYRSYYGTITHIDREVGLILKTLAQTGQADNTIVVFTSDHGDQLLEHGIMGKNCFFEASVRVPLMIRFPGQVKPGRYDELVETIDILPTLFAFADLPEPYENQGRSLAPLISTKGGHYHPREAVFSENVTPEVITGGSLDFEFQKGKGVKGIRHPDAKMVRTHRWKYNYYPGHGAELYDLQNDPTESNNLSGNPRYQSVERDLRDRLLDWLITAAETDQIQPRWLLK